MEANHEKPAPQNTFPTEPYRGFAIDLTTGPSGSYAAATSPEGVRWVTPPYRDPLLCLLHARSLVDRYLRALEIAGMVPFPEDMERMIAAIVADVASTPGTPAGPKGIA